LIRALPKRLLCIAAALAAVGVRAQEVATPTASERFATATAAFGREDYAFALAEFRAAIAAGSAGPAAHYNAAVCEYRLGRYRDAAESFRDLGLAYPEMRALADYNLGLSQYRQNEPALARASFQSAASAGDPQIAALADTMLARLRDEAPAEPPVPRWLGVVDFALGHDDNVALVDPFVLPAGQSGESPFAELSAYAGGSITSSGAWQLSTSLYLIDFTDAPAYDQRIAELGARFEATAGRWLVSAGPRIGRSDIGGDGFERTAGAAVRASHPVAAAAEIALTWSWDSADELEDRFAYIAGERRVLGLRFDQMLALPQSSTRLILEYQQSTDDRVGAGVSAERNLYRLTWRQPWGQSWSGSLHLELRDTDYDRLVPERNEDRIQSGVRAVRRIGTDWQLGLDYRWSDNDSSDPAFTYERNRVAIGASRVF
jgi:tetratricopeptide (TPR) repeat protein